MEKLLPATAMVLAATRIADSAEQRVIDCVGLVTFWPVHDFHDAELRNGVATLELKEIKRNQDDKCSMRITGKNLTKVMKTCRQDKLCKVIGVMGPKGWVRLEQVEDYSERD
jgi:hypothetical protein